MGYLYGQPPLTVSGFSFDWHEYLHYLYLPVVMPGEEGEDDDWGLRLPQRLEFARPLIHAVMDQEIISGTDMESIYVYVSARRGFAHPGNPLNRPGWHADGFGSDDRNYVWSDRWPTRYAVGPIHRAFGGISDDHRISAQQFDAICEHPAMYDVEVYSGEPDTLYRLDPAVVHSTPIIPAPGGDRSFIKISVSPARYNLLGNSHNYLFDYDWHMWPRDAVRNDPIKGGGDAGPQEEIVEAR